MSVKINSIIHATLLCHYGDTNAALLVGGLVKPGETLMACAIRHCRHLVDFRIAHNARSYPLNTMNGFTDHEPLKTSFFIDVLFSRFKWRLVSTLLHWLLPLPTI